MPLLWDIIMSFVTGVLFSSLKPLFKNVYGDELSEKKIFIIGLIFNQLVIWLISIWCWLVVDPNWLMLYWVDPESVRALVHIIYVVFPIFYVSAYVLNLKLRKIGKSRYTLFFTSTLWLIFTICVFPSFISMFAGDDTMLHGVDYPAQLIFNLHEFPEKSIMWIFPLSFRSYFILFFIQVVLFMTLVEILGILIAIKNTINKSPEKPSRSLIFLTGKILDISNKQIIRNAKKDYRYKQFVTSFKATIQVSTLDGYINRFYVFDGKGGLIYCKGKLENPDSMVMYTSVKDLFQYLKSFGDFKLGIKHNRFKVYGNLNVLLKLQFLTNYFNPKYKKAKDIKQKIIAQVD